MKCHVLIVDDDFGTSALVEAFRDSDCDVQWSRSIAEILKDVDKLKGVDIAIVDVRMDCPPELDSSEAHGGHRAGISLARKIREIKKDIPILAYSANSNREVVDWFRSQAGMSFFSKAVTPPQELVEEAMRQLQIPPMARPLPTVFIVHGHDEKTKLETKNYLQNQLHLPEPIILHEQKSGGRTVIEKFERNAIRADFAVVLLTPDDRFTGPDDKEKYRARQNVILELGYFLGTFGRDSGRVLLLHKGLLEIPSDISGVIYIDISDGVAAAGEVIRKELGL